MPPLLTASRWTVQGAVQGVGFRPFVYRLAREMGLSGDVCNTVQGVQISLQGSTEDLDTFERRLKSEIPAPAQIRSIQRQTATLRLDLTEFSIGHSQSSGPPTTTTLPDLATCPECLAEISDPGQRRYRYPFTNCTRCGPRYSIILALPYDRPNTTMRGFPMCDRCREEYADPGDRRFHAQPIACPECGPHVELWDMAGQTLASRDEALEAAAAELAAGKILGLKGIGGFQFLVDATNEEAVRQLRKRKGREAKPLAVMAPSLSSARDIAEIGPAEEEILLSPGAPILILPARIGGVAPSVAPENPNLGVMLPYSPLHHLLLTAFGRPVVATSGNLSDEPLCIEEREAVQRFRDISDVLLVHNRPIARPIDDSVVRFMAWEPRVLRRARGYAPMPIPLEGCPPGLLAVGGHLKNTIALSLPGAAVLSPHIGDLDDARTRDRMGEEVRALEGLYQAEVRSVICDKHPDYASTAFARAECREGEPRAVQHHVAHALGCLAENGVQEPALAVVWDGTGYGDDGTIWGGEFFVCNAGSPGEVQRTAHLRGFPLPGGEAAVREGRRSALGLLAEARLLEHPAAEGFVRESFERSLGQGLVGLIGSGVGCPVTSSVGRLFDAFASLGAGIHRSRFEGEAAMRFEFLYDKGADHYVFTLEDGVLDWQPALEQLLEDLASGLSPNTISGRFHRGLSLAVVEAAKASGLEPVALTGGCFQNRTLLELCVDALRASGFRPITHRAVPPNDGGLSYGQLAASLNQENRPCA